MTEKETYNGWSNYATWLVNLEMVDGMFHEWSRYNGEEPFKNIPALAEYIKEDCEQTIEIDGSDTLIAHSYALAFLSDVNWYEIAKHVAEDYPSIIKSNE